MSFIRGKKPHRVKKIIPIAGITNAVAGLASKASHDLSRNKKKKRGNYKKVTIQA